MLLFTNAYINHLYSKIMKWISFDDYNNQFEAALI